MLSTLPTEEGLRARFFAQFILSGQSEILRFAQNDSEGLGMTVERLAKGEHVVSIRY
jgi:hypothetical protein